MARATLFFTGLALVWHWSGTGLALVWHWSGTGWVELATQQENHMRVARHSFPTIKESHH